MVGTLVVRSQFRFVPADFTNVAQWRSLYVELLLRGTPYLCDASENR